MTPLRSVKTWIATITRNPGVGHAKLRAVARAVRWQIAKRTAWQRAEATIGPAKLYCYPNSTAASGCLYAGFMEWDEMSFVIRFLRAGDLFVDVGANVGTYSVFAGTFVPWVSVVSAEPGREARDRLIENLMLNDLPTVGVVEKALSDSEGTTQFTVGGDVLNAIAGEHTSDTVDTVSVETTTLDAVLDGAIPQLVKIDVEGAELLVAEGAISTLTGSNPPTLLFELNGLSTNFGIDPLEIVSFLRERGYSMFEYDGLTNALTPLADGAMPESRNVIAVADEQFVTTRLTAYRGPDLQRLRIRSRLQRTVRRA